MTDEEKIKYMRLMGDIGEDEEDDENLLAYLLFAQDKLLEHIYPYNERPATLERRYETKQIELAVILYNKKGAEGEKEHTENSVGRKYMTEAEFFASIPRKAGLPK